jgi:hypothetical protein
VMVMLCKTLYSVRNKGNFDGKILFSVKGKINVDCRRYTVMQTKHEMRFKKA